MNDNSIRLFTVRDSPKDASFARVPAAAESRAVGGRNAISSRGMPLPLRPEFEAIQDRWKELCKNGRLPGRSDFPVESLTPWIGHIQIVERVRDGDTVRHRVRLVGTRIVYYEGRDNTGKFLDDVIPVDQRDELLGPYRRCAESRTPVYSAFFNCSDAAISSQLERLILPLAADGKTVDQFLVAIYRAKT